MNSSEERTAQNMVEETTQTPIENDANLTSQGTEGETTPQETLPVAEGSPAPGIDYKEKFSESKREALRIREEAKEKDRKIAELEAKLNNETPSDTELSGKYPDWEFKEEDEKMRIRNEESREKRLRQLEEKIAWDNDYNKILKKYPQLADSEEEFKDEAYKYPKSTSLDIIAKSFLFDRNGAEHTNTTPARPGLESKSGGPKAPLSTGPTLEDITRLRKEEPQKYAEMVRKGLVKIPKA